MHKKDGWAVLQKLTDSYPGVATLRGPLGVSVSLPIEVFRYVLTHERKTQHRILYVWDPVAMNNVVVKEPYVYEEPHWFTRCAFRCSS